MPSPYERQRPQWTRARSGRSLWQSSTRSRLLPMPGAPRTFTSRGRPSVCAPCQISRSRSTSALASDERAATGPGARAAFSPITIQTGTGSDLPLAASGSASSYSKRCARGAEGRLPDGDAVDRRGALETGGGVHHVAGRHALALDARARRRRAPRPCAPRSGCAGRARRPPRSAAATARVIASAARTARSGSSSWAIGAPKRATTASPMNFSTCAAEATRARGGRVRSRRRAARGRPRDRASRRSPSSRRCR